MSKRSLVKLLNELISTNNKMSEQIGKLTEVIKDVYQQKPSAIGFELLPKETNDDINYFHLK